MNNEKIDALAEEWSERTIDVGDGRTTRARIRSALREFAYDRDTEMLQLRAELEAAQRLVEHRWQGWKGAEDERDAARAELKEARVSLAYQMRRAIAAEESEKAVRAELKEARRAVKALGAVTRGADLDRGRLADLLRRAYPLNMPKALKIDIAGELTRLASPPATEPRTFEQPAQDAEPRGQICPNCEHCTECGRPAGATDDPATCKCDSPPALATEPRGEAATMPGGGELDRDALGERAWFEQMPDGAKHPALSGWWRSRKEESGWTTREPAAPSSAQCPPHIPRDGRCRWCGEEVPASAQGTTGPTLEERVKNLEAGLTAKLHFDEAFVSGVEALDKRVSALAVYCEENVGHLDARIVQAGVRIAALDPASTVAGACTCSSFKSPPCAFCQEAKDHDAEPPQPAPVTSSIIVNPPEAIPVTDHAFVPYRRNDGSMGVACRFFRPEPDRFCGREASEHRPAPVERHAFEGSFIADRCVVPNCGGQPRSAAVHGEGGK